MQPLPAPRELLQALLLSAVTTGSSSADCMLPPERSQVTAAPHQSQSLCPFNGHGGGRLDEMSRTVTCVYVKRSGQTSKQHWTTIALARCMSSSRVRRPSPRCVASCSAQHGCWPRTACGMTQGRPCYPRQPPPKCRASSRACVWRQAPWARLHQVAEWAPMSHTAVQKAQLICQSGRGNDVLLSGTCVCHPTMPMQRGQPTASLFEAHSKEIY